MPDPVGGTGPRDVLNLGCGDRHRTDAINLDINPRVRPDVRADLDRVPWPFRDSAFREVFAHDVIEHLADVVVAMEEIHRVCADGAVVHITVPHFSSANAYSDPTHRHQFGWSSFHYFTGEHELDYARDGRFRRRTSHILFAPTLVNKLVWRLANRHPEAYERRWAWMFPAWFVYFELEVIKKRP